VTKRTAAATLVVALAAGLAGCGDGGSDPTAATPTATPTAEQTPTPAPTVSPATGLKLSEETSVLRVPEGWVERQEPLVDWASAVNGPGRGDAILLQDRVSLAGPDATIDSLARSAVKVKAKGAKAKRLPDVDLDGSRAYLIRFTEPGFPDLTYSVCTLRNGHSISVDITLDIKTRRKHLQVVKSVLASFRWKE
jgi:hypothetical protein